MIRKSFLILFLFLLLTPPCLTGRDEAGYALLDKLTDTFRKMAEKGTGGPEAVSQALSGMMAEARGTKEKGEIDPVFYHRYTRILMICRLAIFEDKAGILVPLTENEIAKFIEDIKGERLDPAKIMIGQTADAIAEEIINLHLYLDTKDQRLKLIKEYEQKSSIKK